MDFTVPEEIERLCDGVRRFMDEHVYPLERGARLEDGGRRPRLSAGRPRGAGEGEGARLLGLPPAGARPAAPASRSCTTCS